MVRNYIITVLQLKVHTYYMNHNYFTSIKILLKKNTSTLALVSHVSN